MEKLANVLINKIEKSLNSLEIGGNPSVIPFTLYRTLKGLPADIFPVCIGDAGLKGRGVFLSRDVKQGDVALPPT